MSLREYFAAAGSPFSQQQAEVIGPQLDAMAEEGLLPTTDDEAAKRAIVDTARSENSGLHGFFEWNDAKAADLHRLDQAGKMLRSIRIRYIEDDRPRTAPVYKVAREQAKPTVFARGHNVLRGDSAIAVQKAREAFTELTSWRARYQPFVSVWAGFAQVFRGVANQISEGEDVVQPDGLDDRTDEALTDLQAIQASCLAWQEKHGATADAWAALAEQTGFMVEAIDAAVVAFGHEKPMQRTCLKCRKPFESAGVGNRLCQRCSTVTIPEQARVR